MRTSSKWGLALAAAVLSTGCYGSFSVTKKLYDWNGRVCGTEKGPSSTAAWGNEAVFLICNIIPVYGICAGLIDGLILNSIEFWTGSNPMSSVTVSQLDSTHDLRLEKLSDTTVKVDILEGGNVIGSYTIDNGPNGTVLHDLAGNEVAAATSVDGAVELVAAR